MLRSRQARQEQLAGGAEDEFELRLAAGVGGGSPDVGGPEQEAVLADSVGLALLVVLDTLAPAERGAFVLHDTFGLPFGEIAAIPRRAPPRPPAGPGHGPGLRDPPGQAAGGS